MMLSSLLLLLLAAVGGAFAWFNEDSKGNVALYWGQNSAGKKTTQDRLITYCQKPDVDIIIIAFLIRFNGGDGNPMLNFANQGMAENDDPVKCTLFPGTGLLKCPELEKDIQICQKIKGKTILFSFGGDSYTEGGFTTPQAAIDAANKVWAMFGPPQDNAYHPYPSQVLRPFGHASFDGFDFDFEGPNLNSIAFAKQLRQLMDDYTKGAGNGRKFYLAAAPQCAYPEIWMKEIMENAYLDLIFVQFYNNYCAVSTFVPGLQTQSGCNFDSWDQWARGVSKNKNVKVFMGVPGNVGAGRGYAPPSALGPVIESSNKLSSFGGVMIWDASQAYTNGNFIGDIKKKLNEGTRHSGRSFHIHVRG